MFILFGSQRSSVLNLSYYIKVLIGLNADRSLLEILEKVLGELSEGMDVATHLDSTVYVWFGHIL